jgi:NSS family neurotransmitter:Na+ symporter
MPAREHWGSRIGFILAAAGSAVGLGNIWKFPFITGMYGGAAFVAFYLLSILLIGLPVMLIEISIGRKTQLSPVGAFRSLAPEGPYFLIGAVGVVVGFIILSYYSVVAGWAVSYLGKAIVGGFSSFTSPEAASEAFGEFSSHPYKPLIAHGIFMLLCILVVSRGIKGSIERGNRILMPTLFVIIVLLIVRGVTLPGAGAGISFLFYPDFSKLTSEAMLVAIGHAFFTLSLGVGAMLTYGSYLSEKEDLVKSSLWIIIADTGVALLAGIAIFSTVFAMGFEPDAGPGLVFHVLPTIFAKMPGGSFLAMLFFLLLTIAALTSAMSLLEVVTSYFIDQRGWSRIRATVVLGIAIFIVGIPSVLSFGVLGDVKIFGMILFDFFDYLSFKYAMPLTGFFMVLFTIFRWKPENFLAELRRGGKGLPISAGIATLLLLISALFVGVTFVAGVMGKG